MKQHKQTIVALGDSITQAAAQSPDEKWCAILERRLNAGGKACSIINAGVGGNTSREGLARFEKDVLANHPDLVLIEFGGNDATYEPARRVELNEFTENLGKMVDGLTRISARPVLLTFPPIIDDWHACGKIEFFKKWNGLDRCVEEYRQATREFARKRNLPLADIDLKFRKAFRTQEIGTLILKDGVHLTDEGNELVARTLGDFF
jgi:lysophospholipase L1-like esterase